jgi:CBS domain-containing protein
MRVSNLMTMNVECTPPDATLQTAAEKMKVLDVGSLPVCEHDRLAGMVTDRDIVVRAIAEGRNPAEVPVRDIMTPEVTYCFEDDDVEHAAQLMKQKQIRRLLVLNRQKRLVGIVSLGDLAIESGDDLLAGETLERISEPAIAV